MLPLAVRDNYHGGAQELATVNLAFWAATIVAAIAFAGLARRFSLRGRLIGIAVAVGSLILVALAWCAWWLLRRRRRKRRQVTPG